MMKVFTFRGLMAPVFTPFHNDETRSLNLNIIPKYAEFLKESGIDGILVNGTTGEGVSQTVEEREKVAGAWMAAATKTGQTVMIQVGGTNLSDVQRLARNAEKLNASSILCLADLFHQPRTARDLLHYLQLVGQAAPNTPLLYYHIPAFTGIDVNMKEMLELAELDPSQGGITVPTLAGLKFTCNDLSMAASLLTINRQRYTVFLGSDTILAGALCLGLDSAIGTTLNIVPKLNQKIVSAMRKGDVVTARAAQEQLSDVVRSISSKGSWVGSMKSAMRATSSIDVGPVRHPLLDLKPEQLPRITTDIAKINKTL